MYLLQYFTMQRSRSTAFNTNRRPEPNGPAKPVPLLQPATNLGGKTLIYPSMTDSPNACIAPQSTEPSKQVQNPQTADALDDTAIMTNAQIDRTIATKIRFLWAILMKNFELIDLITPESTIRELENKKINKKLQ